MKDWIPFFLWETKVSLLIDKAASMAIKQGCGKLEEDRPYVFLRQEFTLAVGVISMRSDTMDLYPTSSFDL
jgi:hypothetical protein